METLILNILSVLFIFLIIFCIYLLFRSHKVLKFRHFLIDLAYKYAYEEIIKGNFNYKTVYEQFVYKYTYANMLFSFKPLKLESWYTKEEIEKIKKHNTNTIIII